MSRALSSLVLLACSAAPKLAWVQDGSVAVTEIAPWPTRGYPELIELHNPTPEPVSLAGWVIAGDCEHAFAPSARLEPFAYFTLTPTLDRYRNAYGHDAGAALAGGLPDERGSFTIHDALGRIAARADWIAEPGSLAHFGGATLELASAAHAAAPGFWQPSRLLGGTPGRRNSIAVSLVIDPVVSEGALWRYWKGTSAPAGGAQWTLPEFDDSAWESGPVPLGFGGGEATTLADMRGSYAAVLLRRVFTYREAAAAAEAVLSLRFDDGFIAYLNGVEIARRNMGPPGTPWPVDAPAAARQEAEDVVEEVRVGGVAALLRSGRNVLGIHAANDHIRGNDFIIHPALAVMAADSIQDARPVIRINEAWIEDGATLVELHNPGSSPLVLAGGRLLGSHGGPGVELGPGAVVPARSFYLVRADAALLPAQLTLVSAGGILVDTLDLPMPLEGAASGRFPDGCGGARLLARRTPGVPNAAAHRGEVVITEIHYNPVDPDAEFIELAALDAVDLEGWALSGAARFTFPGGAALEAGGRLVVARDPRRLQLAPGAGPLLGPYRGRLANDAEEVLLLDREGRPLDRVRYADDGSWPAAADDGLVSMELVDISRDNDAGAAWSASLVEGGTPGLPNSVESPDAPPLIAPLRVSPAVPRPGEAVEVITRVEPAAARAELLWRRDGELEFQRLPLELSGDSRRAVLPAQADGTVLELAVEAWDPLRPGTPRSRSPRGEPGSILVSFDARVESPFVPLYRLTLRSRHWDSLRSNLGSDETYPATFVAGGRAYFDARARVRGHGSRFVEPKSYRVLFTEENPFEGKTAILLNGNRPERQVLGMDVWRRAGMPYSQARSVQLLAQGHLHRHYACVEPVDDDYLDRHFGDAGGNLYRGQRDADLSYLGESGAAYETLYEKRTNVEARDWSDVAALARVLAASSDSELPEALERHIDIDQWLRWLAINSLLSNQEGGLHRDSGDDYFIYRPPNGRFVLLPWDMDSTFSVGEEPIFRPTLPAIRRLLTHPRLAPRYYQAFSRALDTYFTSPAIARQAALLAPVTAAEVIDELVTFVRDRSAFVRRSIPEKLTLGVMSGGWGSGEDLWAAEAPVRLGGRVPAAMASRVLVNGQAAEVDAVSAAWSFDLGAAAEGRVRVELLDADGMLAGTATGWLRRAGAGNLVTALPEGRSEWSLDGSPYVLLAEVEVPAGAELVLGPGTHVLALPDATLRVEGALRAAGTAERPVRFENARPDAAWRGIRLVEGATAELVHCELGSPHPGAAGPEGPAMVSAEKAALAIRSCVFRNQAAVAVEVVDAELTVIDSVFLATLEAVHGVRSQVVAAGNLIAGIRGDSDGIDLDGDAGQRGLLCRIEHNTVWDVEDDGIDILDASPLVRGNIVRRPGDRGISIEGAGETELARNVIAGAATGVAVKDGARVVGANNTVTSCRRGLWLFVKSSGSAGAAAAMHSTIVWGNDDDIHVDAESQLSLDHSDAGESPGDWGPDNFDADPLFSDDDTLRLQAGSPCAGRGRDGTDAGAGAIVLPGPVEITAVEPAVGSTSGGQVIVLSGDGLEDFLEVRIGGEPLEHACWVPTGRVVGILPAARRAGAVDIDVTTRAGHIKVGGGFRYTRRVLRGDASGDMRIDVSDAVLVIRRLFAGGSLAVCEEVSDWDADGGVQLNDALALLRHLFQRGPGPRTLFIDCP